MSTTLLHILKKVLHVFIETQSYTSTKSPFFMFNSEKKIDSQNLGFFHWNFSLSNLVLTCWYILLLTWLISSFQAPLFSSIIFRRSASIVIFNLSPSLNLLFSGLSWEGSDRSLVDLFSTLWVCGSCANLLVSCTSGEVPDGGSSKRKVYNTRVYNTLL